MNLGLALNLEYLAGKPVKQGDCVLLSKYGSVRAFLDLLKSRGINYIDIHNAYPESNSDFVSEAVKLVWGEGMKVSLHGGLKEYHGECDFLHIYPSLAGIMKEICKNQESIVIAVHAFSKKNIDIDNLANETVKVITRWIEMIDTENLPVRFAVELNRARNIADPSVTCEGVLNLLARIGEKAGICWDMGHYYSNFLNNKGLFIPEAQFVNKTIHTHIHGIGAKGTHCPITKESMAFIGEYANMLYDAGYPGIYNMELSYEKFPPDNEIDALILQSIENLKFVLSSIHYGML